MNGRLDPQTLRSRKELRFLNASSILEDAIYILTRPVKTLRCRRSKSARSGTLATAYPAMAADSLIMFGPSRAFDCGPCSTAHEHLKGRPPSYRLIGYNWHWMGTGCQDQRT